MRDSALLAAAISALLEAFTPEHARRSSEVSARFLQTPLEAPFAPLRAGQASCPLRLLIRLTGRLENWRRSGLGFCTKKACSKDQRQYAKNSAFHLFCPSFSVPDRDPAIIRPHKYVSNNGQALDLRDDDLEHRSSGRRKDREKLGSKSHTPMLDLASLAKNTLPPGTTTTNGRGTPPLPLS